MTGEEREKERCVQCVSLDSPMVILYSTKSYRGNIFFSFKTFIFAAFMYFDQDEKNTGEIQRNALYTSMFVYTNYPGELCSRKKQEQTVPRYLRLFSVSSSFILILSDNKLGIMVKVLDSGT